MDEVELLSADQERRLARTIEAGILAEHLLATGDRPVVASMAELNALATEGRHAWEHFWLANVRLVWMLAGAEAARARLSAEELFQEGCVALAGAMQRFDPERGRFSTYALPRIRRHLHDVAATRFGELSLPTSRAVQLWRLRGQLSRLDQEYRREVGAKEVAAEAELPTAWVRSVLSHRRPVPLETVDDRGLVDEAATPVDRRMVAAEVRELLDRVPAAEADVLSLRYGLGGAEQLSLAAVAGRLRMSPSTARRLELRGLARLRQVVAGPLPA
ncbi:MAG: sigma-70 family RNA polymerase sigma factor [Propionibacteriales bacterium]|nr:sigma-70 family RNA polymerase sigma factor [Propionibacteriales bacterium]